MHDTEISTLTELKQAGVVGAQVAGTELVAVAGGDDVYVYEGRCPHQGTLLSEGHVEDGHLVCRGHGWQFNCASGVKVDDTRIGLQGFSVLVDCEKVLVDQAEIAAWAERRTKTALLKDQRPLRVLEQLPGPGTLPVFGNLHQITPKRFHLILEDWYRQYGDLYQIKLGSDRAVVIADPEMVREILQARPDKFARSNGIRQTIQEMGVEGLFSAEGEQWRRHRHLATRAFDVRHLREFFPIMTKVTRRLYNRWRQLAVQDQPIDVQQELMRYTVDITTNLAFGYDMNTLEEEGDRIQRHLERIFPKVAFRAFMPVRYWNVFKLPSDRALESSLVELRGAIDQFIDHARRQLAENPTLRERPQNLLQALLVAQADEDVEFSDLEIYGNVLTFLLAGEDTTANSIAWLMYFMTEYPEVQRRMQCEADAVLSDEQAVSDYASINDLPYIEAVTHETMRFKPVAPFLALQALTNVSVDSLKIPKGTQVLLLLRPKGLEDLEFTSAGAFKPDRWLNYSPQDNPHHSKSFLPFGAGPRLCPGRSLALLEIKMVVTMICRHFDVARVDANREIQEQFVFAMMPQDLMMTLQPRSS